MLNTDILLQFWDEISSRIEQATNTALADMETRIMIRVSSGESYKDAYEAEYMSLTVPISCLDLGQLQEIIKAWVSEQPNRAFLDVQKINLTHAFQREIPPYDLSVPTPPGLTNDLNED